MQAVDRTFRAMGCAAEVRMVAGSAADAAAMADAAIARVEGLERRWSRFSAHSEVSLLNASSGLPVVVSADTALLVSKMVEAWRRVEGRYDPTLLEALRRVGYADSWDPRRGLVETATTDAVLPGRGCRGISVDLACGLVELPAGVAVEPGGIGKGLAGDLVTAAAVDTGAVGAMVNLGGDVRVRGVDVDGGTWTVAIEDPHQPEIDLAVVALDDGAVCTSSRTFRRWLTPTGPAHHLLDPADGRPVDGAIDAVTVIADEGWWAEALTKAAFVEGMPNAVGLVRDHGAVALVVEADGGVVSSDDRVSVEDGA